jgi:uncharacterized DUF497 family protein
MVYDRTYITYKFEWDRRKASTNLGKHGIDFADATEVLFDPLAITVHDTDAERDGDRFVTIGSDGLGRILVVVFTWRKDRIRIISARKATPRERREYGRTP